MHVKSISKGPDVVSVSLFPAAGSKATNGEVCAPLKGQPARSVPSESLRTISEGPVQELKSPLTSAEHVHSRPCFKDGL